MADTDLTIVPYIPFSCALLQKVVPADSSKGIIIDYGFTPAWFADRCDVDFGRRWHTDSRYRRDSFVLMANVLNNDFPGLGLGGDPSRIRGSISGVLSCALPAAIFGQDIRYDPRGWPINEGEPLTDRQVDELDVPDYHRHPAFNNLMDQMDQIEHDWGAVEGELNFQSVMNTAFRLRGTRLFLDMYDNPERVNHLYDVLYRTLVSLVDEVHDRQARSGAPRSFFVTANCVVNMTSNDHYRTFLMPLDEKLHGHYPYFGIHNCNWSVDDYLESYRQVGTIRYLDFGMKSDLSRVRELFPRATRVVFYRISGKTPSSIESDLLRLRDADACTRIFLSAVDASVPNEIVLHFFSVVARLWNKPIHELLCDPPNY
jgi:hypothetical protein